jgi:pyrroloquinoline-quinone synthase
LGAENHPELWLRFVEGLGLTREEVINAPRHSMTQKCIDELMALAADANPAVGLSALYAYESPLPAISQSKIDGLKQFYGINDPRAVNFFEVHKTADVWHSEQEKSAITRMKAAMSDVQLAVEKSCAALWTFMDGVHQATGKVGCCQA